MTGLTPALARRWLRTTHGVMGAAVGVTFLLDAHGDRLAGNPTYAQLGDAAAPWFLVPVLAGVAVVAGHHGHRRRVELAGFAGLALFYAGQTALFLWPALAGRATLYGPIGVYVGLGTLAVTHVAILLSTDHHHRPGS